MGFNWHNLRKDVILFRKECLFCNAKTPTKVKSGNNPILINNPKELLVIDTMEVHCIVKKFTNNIKYLLNCKDHFSKYSWSLPLKSHTSEEVAEKLKSIFDIYVPKKVLSDNGTEFKGVVGELIKVF